MTTTTTDAARDEIIVTDAGTGEPVTLVAVYEDDPDAADLACEACGEPILFGYAYNGGAGGITAWCPDCVADVFTAPKD